jgi:hypothetical protein
MLIASGDVLRITGLPQTTLNRWSDLVRPVNNHAGHGNHRKFSVMQTLALAYAKVWADQGCGFPWVREVVKFVANLSQDDLETHLNAGRRLLIPMPEHLGGSHLVEPQWYDDPKQRALSQALDLGHCYATVMSQVNRLESRNGKR